MLLTVNEYAKKAGIGNKAVYRAIKEHRLKSVKKYGRILVEVKDEKPQSTE